MKKAKIAIFHSSIFEEPSLGDLRQKFSEIGEVSYFPFLVESPNHLKAEASEADIIIMNDVPLSFDDLQDFPHLKMISLLGSGYDMIDLAGMQRGGVAVLNAPTYGIENVAQHAVALLFELAHRIGQQHRQINDTSWNQVRPHCIQNFPIMELQGKTLGIVGYGNTAARVKEMLSGFNMKFAAASARSELDLAACGVEKMSLQQLFAAADIITIHARSTPENKHCINAELLAEMKPTSLLINTARGDLINEEDLAHALKNKQLAGAGLDVLAQEPPAAENPLLQLSNCILTPHIAWNSQAGRERLTHETLANVSAFLAQRPINQVN